MRETRADTARAFGLALLVHALLFGGLLMGLWWTEKEAPAAAGGAVAADVVDVGELSASMQRALRNAPEPLPVPVPDPVPEPEPAPAPPQPEPEPAPQDAPAPAQQKAQELLPEPDTESRQAVVEQPTPNPAAEKKVQEAKRRQEQVDLTERERQQEAEQKRRLAEQEATERRIAEIRKRRAAAAREAQLAEQRLQQLADARRGNPAEDAARADAAASQPGAGGTDAGLMAKYAAALQSAITAKWTRPETIADGALCRLIIRQLPGGEVVDVQVSSPCSYDEQGRRSIEAAVLKAQPLPYAGFEPVFQRTLTLNFRAPE